MHMFFSKFYGSTDGARRAPDLTPVLLKLINAAAAGNIMLTEQGSSSTSTSASASVSSTSGEAGKDSAVATASATVSVTSHHVTPQQAAAKNAIEIACWWSQVLNNFSPFRSLASLPTGHPSNPEGVGALLGLALRGSGHADVEVAGFCNATSHFHVCSAISGGRGAALARSVPSSSSSASLSAPLSDPLSITLAALVKHRGHSSFYVRGTVMLAVTSFMLDNWSVLTEAEKKSVKETFSEGLHDSKPEVSYHILPYLAPT